MEGDSHQGRYMFLLNMPFFSSRHVLFLPRITFSPEVPGALLPPPEEGISILLKGTI